MIYTFNELHIRLPFLNIPLSPFYPFYPLPCILNIH